MKNFLFHNVYVRLYENDDDELVQVSERERIAVISLNSPSS